MAVECALENSIATLIGPLFVANLANAFGYKFGRVKALFFFSRGVSAVVLGEGEMLIKRRSFWGLMSALSAGFVDFLIRF